MATVVEHTHVRGREEQLGIAQVLRPTVLRVPARHAVYWRACHDVSATHSLRIALRIACTQGTVDFQTVEVPWVRKLIQRVPLRQYFDEPRDMRLSKEQARAVADALLSADLMTEDELRAREEHLQRDTA